MDCIERVRTEAVMVRPRDKAIKGNIESYWRSSILPMEISVITLESAGRVALPDNPVAAFALHPGSRLAVSIRPGWILLQPLLADNLDDLCGIFSSETDLVEELQQERRQDKW